MEAYGAQFMKLYRRGLLLGLLELDLRLDIRLLLIPLLVLLLLSQLGRRHGSVTAFLGGIGSDSGCLPANKECFRRVRRATGGCHYSQSCGPGVGFGSCVRLIFSGRAR